MVCIILILAQQLYEPFFVKKFDYEYISLYNLINLEIFLVFLLCLAYMTRLLFSSTKESVLFYNLLKEFVLFPLEDYHNS